jgi:hypothetical protein
MREIIGLLAEIFLHRERHGVSQVRQHACAQANGDSTAKKRPQCTAAINCIHCSSPCRMPLSPPRLRVFDQPALNRLPVGASLGISPGR